MLVEICFDLIYCVIEKGVSILFDHATEAIIIELGILLSGMKKIKNTLNDIVDSSIYDAVINFSDAVEHIKHYKKHNSEKKHEKYLERCIFQSSKTLANRSSNIKNMILAIELRLVSQILLGEPIDVVRKMTESRLLEFTKLERVINMYHELASSGRDFNEPEMVNAYNLYKLCKNLIGINSDSKLSLTDEKKIIDNKFLNSLPIKIHNPRVRWRTFGERCARNTAKGFTGLFALPLSFVAGTIVSVYTVLILPVVVPIRITTEAVETKGNSEKIKTGLSDWYNYNEIPACLLGPVTGVSMVAEALTDSPDDDGYVNGDDFFKKWGILISAKITN